MNRQFEAIFENGVFRPLTLVDLPPHQRVTVTVPDQGETVAAEAHPPMANGEDASSDETEDSPWRGVFVPPRKRQVLFTHELPARQQELTSL